MHLDEALRAIALQGNQRGGQRRENRQLAAVTLLTRRQLGAQREGALERACGAGVVV